MKKNNLLSKLITKLFSQSVNRLLVISFTLVALVPVSFLGVKLYQAAWEDAWREIYEKHRLLALNLASPIEMYLNDRRSMLMMLASSLKMIPQQSTVKDSEIIEKALNYISDFKSIVLLDAKGITHLQISDGKVSTTENDIFANDPSFISARDKNRWSLSGIESSKMDGKPCLVLVQPVRDAQKKVVGALLAELGIETIEKLRRNIAFGEKGHSAIVDNYGHVIAHPNPKWMQEMKDLSSWEIVKKMLAGETGVTEFYSSFVKKQMVAGYTSVPVYGWGIMVPQPKSEVEARVYKLLFSQLSWALAGLILSIVLAVALARWITGPINRLAAAAKDLGKNSYMGKLPDTYVRAPREVCELGNSLRNLVSGLQASQEEVTQLNEALQDRVDEATAQLREANRQLEALVQSDHLTRLANRRHFENTLLKAVNRRSSDTDAMCLLLIDIDYFKEINDQYGHSAGDTVLMQVAGLLESAMRQGDLVARYGGDEFVAHMRCDLEIGRQRAKKIRETIDEHQFFWQGQELHLTVSIGLLSCDMAHPPELEKMLREVDKAMYQAKKQGRNDVAEVICSNGKLIFQAPSEMIRDS